MRLTPVVSGFALAAALTGWVAGKLPVRAASHADAREDFRTSDRCVACHNGLKTSGGEDISIGMQWGASVMANSSRDPYWQASVRRETIDHGPASLAIQDECSTCHMPMQHLIDRQQVRKTEIFQYLPFRGDQHRFTAAEDGVSCSVCHQVERAGLGTQETFNGNVAVARPKDKNNRPEYGPFLVDAGHQKIMQSSTAGFVPTQAAHIRDSALCGSCHTLYTVARDANGKPVGKLPEQMPYLEWLHSDFPGRYTCQQCHMPPVQQPVAIATAFGPERDGMHRHVVIGGNVLLLDALNRHRDELGTQAPPQELDESLNRTRQFLETQSARVSIHELQRTAHGISLAVEVQNLTGHKMPTAFPSRRAWLHVTVRDRNGRIVFESGALRPDGSIVGNDNDANPLRYEPHYREITRPDQVEIYESILKDQHGNVTTGIIAAVGYLKDNRLLPSGFDKNTAQHDIEVVGDAATDPSFRGGSSSTRYMVDTGSAEGPFHVEAELWYQPVGFRWAHNLASYQATETQRFVRYFDAEAGNRSVLMAHAGATQ